MLLIFSLTLITRLYAGEHNTTQAITVSTYDTSIGYCEIYSHNESEVGKFLFPALAIFKTQDSKPILIALYIIRDNPDGSHEFLKLNLNKWYHYIPEQDIY